MHMDALIYIQICNICPHSKKNGPELAIEGTALFIYCSILYPHTNWTTSKHHGSNSVLVSKNK